VVRVRVSLILSLVIDSIRDRSELIEFSTFCHAIAITLRVYE